MSSYPPENEDEYNFSKKSLIRYISCESSKKSLGDLRHTKLIEYLQNLVWPQEYFWANHHFMGIPHYDERTTSPLEGNNAAMKNSYTGIKPNSKLGTSTGNILKNPPMINFLVRNRKSAYQLISNST